MAEGNDASFIKEQGRVNQKNGVDTGILKFISCGACLRTDKTEEIFDATHVPTVCALCQFHYKKKKKIQMQSELHPLNVHNMWF